MFGFLILCKPKFLIQRQELVFILEQNRRKIVKELPLQTECIRFDHNKNPCELLIDPFSYDEMRTGEGMTVTHPPLNKNTTLRQLSVLQLSLAKN